VSCYGTQRGLELLLGFLYEDSCHLAGMLNRKVWKLNDGLRWVKSALQSRS